MTLDEAIQHCEEVAEDGECADCMAEHFQLATWLKQLKIYKKEEELFRESFTKLNDAIEMVCTFCDLMTYHNRCVSDSVNYIRNFMNTKFYKTEVIRVGDEVINIGDNKTTIVVTVIDEKRGIFSGINSNGDPYVDRSTEYWRKTGRHFPEITQAFAKMKENV